MEAVKIKKPRPKARVPQPVPSERPPPPLPAARSRLQVQALNVPTSSARSRSASPEPEVVEFDTEAENAHSVPEPQSQPATPTRPAPAPPLPPRNLIFPRTQTSSTSSREAPPLPEKTREHEAEPATATTSHYPAIPQPAELNFPQFTREVSEPPPAYSQLLHDARSIAATSSKPIAMTAPPLYPSISKVIFDKTDQGLLTEQHLLSFYHNPLYEQAEDFVERFITQEDCPSGPLLPLIQRLKEVSEQLALCDISEKENAEQLRLCVRDCWTIEEKTINYQGKCAENREGSGVGRYQSACLSDTKTQEMRRLLSANTSIIVNQRLSLETEFRSLGLQIQWKVLSLINRFLAENGVTRQSPPNLLEMAMNGGARTDIRSALTDLFHHLRYPSLPKRFIDAVTSWITELTSILYKMCSSEDCQFVLCHLTRLPSPVYEWAAPLIHSFVTAQTPHKVKIDHCLTLLSYILSPIRHREQFLRHIEQSEREDQSWAILGDDSMQEEEFSFVTINEVDLVNFLDQLPISDFYSIATVYFSQKEQEKSAQLVALIAFQLLLMRILHEGLATYGSPNYKLLCKHIGMFIRQSIRELCVHWRVMRGQLSPGEEDQLQREVDRVVLLGVHYIIQHRQLGLWQFLVDLPFECVSEECRIRTEYLMRTTDNIGSVKELYDIPLPEITSRNQRLTIVDRVNKAGDLDAVFFVNALAVLKSHAVSEPTAFVREIIETCFCDDASRERLYKVGGEAISQILLHKPSLLDVVLTCIDRRIDSMGQYALNTLSSAKLSDCRVGAAVVGSVLGKWLINREPDHPANRLARRVLSSLHWGYDDKGALWMDLPVHVMCAETVAKAHSAQCSKSNGMIAKSVQKIAKLASKIPDYEHHFNQFVWDILIKLKLPVKSSTSSPSKDLASYFLLIVKNGVSSVDLFLEKGVPLLNDLVAAGCATASVIAIHRLILRHYANVTQLSVNKGFMDVFERLLHIDQCSYAVQLLSGPSSTPTPIVRLISSCIVSACNSVSDCGQYLRAWVELLCVRRIGIWNTDQVSLQLLGTITKLAFWRDNQSFLGIKDMLHGVYGAIQSETKENGKGLFSIFSGEQPVPPLIQTTYFAVAPWTTYLLLMVEQESFPAFYQSFFDSLGKKDKNSVEGAIKKAVSKSSICLTSDRIHCYRWAEFFPYAKSSEIAPLVVQQLATTLFTKRPSNGKKMVFANKLVNAVCCESIMRGCKTELDSVAHAKGFYKAVSSWIFCNVDVSAPGFNFGQFDLDYLLQLILADDRECWLDFVDLNAISLSLAEEEKLVTIVCAENRCAPVVQGWDGPSGKEKTGRALALPMLPVHHGLPPAPVIVPTTLTSPQLLMDKFSSHVHSINSLTSQFVSSSDELSDLDRAYCHLLNKLYVPRVHNVSVSVRCRNCAEPSNVSVQVTVQEFSSSVDAEMTKNREKRGTQIVSLQATLVDSAAVQTATLEFIADLVSQAAASVSQHLRQQYQAGGRALFYLLTTSVTADKILFPAAKASFENALFVLGQEFIRFRPEEQLHIVALVLDGFVLSEPLVKAFTAECLAPGDLCSVYSQLSQAISNPARSPRAFALMSQLAMDKAAASLPAHQFSALIPLAFNNLAAHPDPQSEFHKLCLTHLVTFTFHKFPSNFVHGLDVTLAGCSSGSTPLSFFDVLLEKIGAKQWENARGEYTVNGVTALECCVTMTRRLSDARSMLGANLYTVWQKFMDPVTLLAQCFLHTAARETYSSDLPHSALANALAESFGRICGVFSPLLVGPSTSIPPFSGSHLGEAGLVVDRMVATINALPYNQIVKQGDRNVPSFVWQFYCERLSNLTHGTAVVFPVFETYLVRIHWNEFMPSLRALMAMDDVLASRSADCFPLISQIIARVPWLEVITTSVPRELLPSYLSTLFSVFTRLLARASNYTKVRASIVELLKQLSRMEQWTEVDAEKCETLGASLCEILPADSLHKGSDAVSVHLSIWRSMCCFASSSASPSPEILLKQRAFVTTELRLLLREGLPLGLSSYAGLLADCHAIATHHPEIRSFCVVARELTAVWARVAEQNMGESLVTAYLEFLSANPESPLILCSLHTVVGSLNADQMPTALRVMDRALRIYFQRRECSWADVQQWVSFPQQHMSAVKHYLFMMPSSVNKHTPLLLTLRVLLDYGIQEDEIFNNALNLLITMKPKYIDCEASLVVLLRRILQWCLELYKRGPTAGNAAIYQFVRALTRTRTEEKGGFLSGIIGGKKGAVGHNVRTLLHVMELYINQQCVSTERAPRLKGTEPVLNSTIAALKELAAQKVNQSNETLRNVFNECTVFFVRVEDHTLVHAPLLMQNLAKALVRENFAKM